MDPFLFTLLFVLFFFALYGIIVYFYIRLLQVSLELSGLEVRTIEPSFLWIQFFPLVGQGWNMLISYQVAVSLRNKIETLPVWKSTQLLFVFAVSHSFVLASCVVAIPLISKVNWVLFPLAMILMAGWIWQLASIHTFIRSQSEQN